MEYLRREHKKTVDKRRKNGPAFAVYLLKLPSDPEDLRNAHPGMYSRIFPDGEDPLARLDQVLVMQIDASFGCRGGIAASSKALTIAKAAAPAPAAPDMLQFMQTMMMQMFQNGGMQNGDLPNFRRSTPGFQSGAFQGGGFQGGGGARRSFRALEEPPTPFDPRQPLGPPSQPAHPPNGASIVAAGAAAAVANQAVWQAAEDQAQAELEAPDADAQSEEATESSTSPGDVMLNAMLERDAAAKKAAAETAAAKKRDAKDAKLAAALAASGDDNQPKKAKTVAEPGIKPSVTTPAVELPTKKNAIAAKQAKTAAEPGIKPSVTKPASMSHEGTRSQYLCRTGVQGEPSTKFRYLTSNGDPAEYPNKKAAFNAANAWMMARK